MGTICYWCFLKPQRRSKHAREDPFGENISTRRNPIFNSLSGIADCDTALPLLSLMTKRIRVSSSFEANGELVNDEEQLEKLYVAYHCTMRAEW